MSDEFSSRFDQLWADGWRVENAEFFDAYAQAGFRLTHRETGKKKTMRVSLHGAQVMFESEADR